MSARGRCFVFLVKCRKQESNLTDLAEGDRLKTNADEKRVKQFKKVIRVKKTSLGKGVFARQAFGVDEVVGEIDGDVVGLDWESSYCMDLGGKALLEPHWPFRFLNHSCEPNCELMLWKYRKVDGKKLHRIWVNTIRTIDVGDEMTIDYAWPAETAMRCLCGAKNCRGWVADKDELKKEKRGRRA